MSDHELQAQFWKEKYEALLHDYTNLANQLHEVTLREIKRLQMLMHD